MTEVAGRLRTTVEALSVAGIDFVIVGGVAAALQGATRVTQDVDILFDRDPANRSLLATFLVAHHARPRGRPKDLDALHELRALADVQRAEADARAEPLT